VLGEEKWLARELETSPVPVSREDVEYVARLARIELTDDQKNTLTSQLSSILGHIEKLNELDTEGVEPTFHVLEVTNVFREDEVCPSLPVEEVLKNAPARDDGFFKVPKIIEFE
jgi:aspartyl-tRNA(Asn)/glutamyl-tRNA(Gln) amidotransferase subunit C